MLKPILRGMDWRGHAGLTLAVLSIAGYLLKIADLRYNAVILLATALSSIPDIDLKVEIPHRKYTHNVFFGLALSALFGYGTYYVINDFTLGFASMAIAFLLHIAGDLLTYRSFNPLAPVAGRPVSLKLFRSSNKAVNAGLMLIGGLLYLLYIARVVYLMH